MTCYVQAPIRDVHTYVHTHIRTYRCGHDVLCTSSDQRRSERRASSGDSGDQCHQWPRSPHRQPHRLRRRPHEGCVRVYVCMHACTYARMHACMYVCIYVCMYVCMYFCACVRAYVRACVCMCVCTCDGGSRGVSAFACLAGWCTCTVAHAQ